MLEDDENPYETLDESASMGTHMLAGAAAGIMEHTVMYPVDCVKVIFFSFTILWFRSTRLHRTRSSPISVYIFNCAQGAHIGVYI